MPDVRIIPASGSLQFTGSSAADSIHVQYTNSGLGFTAGSTRMFISSSGNVGIGITTPSESLDVNGTARIVSRVGVGSSPLSNRQFYVVGSSTFEGQLDIRATSANARTQFTPSANDLFIRSNDGSVQAISIFQGGNIAMGTETNAGYKLDVNGTARVQDTLTVTSLSSNGALILQQNTVGNITQVLNRPNITNSFAQLGFYDLKSGAGNRSFGFGIGRSGDPQWTNGDFIFAYYSGSGGWQQSAKIFNASGNWAIENGTATSDITSAILQVNSTTKGFLPPRMTLAQRVAISTPASGLIVYETGSVATEGLWVNETTGWQQLLTNTGSQSISGSLTVTGGITGSIASASFAATASKIISNGSIGGGNHYFYISTYPPVGGNVGVIQTSNLIYNSSTNTLPTTSSWATSSMSSSYVNTLTQGVVITGSLKISNPASGVPILDTTVGKLYDVYGGTSVNFGSWQLQDYYGITTLDWYNKRLQSAGNIFSVDWQNRTLNNGEGASVLNWSGSGVQVTGSLIVSNSLDTSVRRLYDSTTIDSIDWEGRTLIGPSGYGWTIDWGNNNSYDSSFTISTDWQNRQLYDIYSSVSVDWQNRELVDGYGTVINWNTNPNKEHVNLNTYMLKSVSAIKQDLFSRISVTGFTYDGESINGTKDTAVNQFDVVYLHTDGIWYQTPTTGSGAQMLQGICVEAASGTNKSFFLLEGNIVITDDIANTDVPYVQSLNHGLPIYLRDNGTGQMSTSVPTNTSNRVRILGHAYYNNGIDTKYWIMKFRPSNDWITI